MSVEKPPLNQKILILTVFLIGALLTKIVLFGKGKPRFPGGVTLYSLNMTRVPVETVGASYSYGKYKNLQFDFYSGLALMFPVQINVALKDGTEYKRSLDLPALVAEMAKTHEFPNTQSTGYGGSAALEIEAGNTLIVKYRLAEGLSASPYSSKTHKYELYKEVIIN